MPLVWGAGIDNPALFLANCKDVDWGHSEHSQQLVHWAPPVTLTMDFFLVDQSDGEVLHTVSDASVEHRLN